MNETVVASEVTARYVASPALVAATKQVPTLDALKTPLVTEQLALPAMDTASLTAPEPEPPDVDRAMGVPT